MKFKTTKVLAAMTVAVCASTESYAADDKADTKAIVDAAVRPVMNKYQIPGMEVATAVRGNTYVFDYGVASKETGKHVTPATLFELGSISKTFTVTLASWAQRPCHQAQRHRLHQCRA